MPLREEEKGTMLAPKKPRLFPPLLCGVFYRTRRLNGLNVDPRLGRRRRRRRRVGRSSVLFFS